jgi:hypothetical protein
MIKMFQVTCIHIHMKYCILYIHQPTLLPRLSARLATLSTALALAPDQVCVYYVEYELGNGTWNMVYGICNVECEIIRHPRYYFWTFKEEIQEWLLNHPPQVLLCVCVCAFVCVCVICDMQ